jgi:hypothetical protein
MSKMYQRVHTGRIRFRCGQTQKIRLNRSFCNCSRIAAIPIGRDASPFLFSRLRVSARVGLFYNWKMVELVGLEPTASSLRTTRSPN